jgi:DNA polymerase III delta prime subunit
MAESPYKPWTEKYRPQSLSDLKQDYADRMAALTNEGHQLHFLLLGKPGIGKTTTAGCLAHDLFAVHEGKPLPSQIMESAYRIINASDERNATDVFRHIKSYAHVPIALTKAYPHLKGMKKLFVLDEADALTPKAQELLGLLIEEYKERLQFVLTGNDAGKIHRSLKSACLMIYCTYPSVDHQCDYLAAICKREGVKANRAGLEALVDFARNDLRQATNAVQSVAVTQGRVDETTVKAVCEEASSEMIQEWLIGCWFREPDEARELLADIMDTGYMAKDLLYSVRQVLIESPPPRIPSPAVLRWLEALADLMLVNGPLVATSIQMEALNERFLAIRSVLKSTQ